MEVATGAVRRTVKVDGAIDDIFALQDKIVYAPAFQAPDHSPVKAEIRVMLLRPPDAKELVPLIFLVRLSRGKMLGVDHNKGQNWVGGSVGIWQR